MAFCKHADLHNDIWATSHIVWTLSHSGTCVTIVASPWCSSHTHLPPTPPQPTKDRRSTSTRVRRNNQRACVRSAANSAATPVTTRMAWCSIAWATPDRRCCAAMCAAASFLGSFRWRGTCATTSALSRTSATCALCGSRCLQISGSTCWATWREGRSCVARVQKRWGASPYWWAPLVRTACRVCSESLFRPPAQVERSNLWFRLRTSRWRGRAWEPTRNRASTFCTFFALQKNLAGKFLYQI